MYSLAYPAPGDPALSSRISELFSKGNLPISLFWAGDLIMAYG